jgi:cysteine desulfurase
VARGHKFHGPKGVGLLYINDNIKVKPSFLVGDRKGTCGLAQKICMELLGLAKALELAMANHETESAYIQSLKTYMAEQLRKKIKGVVLNGDQEGKCLYTVLSVAFQKQKNQK